jgi:hypothetical protein
LVQHRERACECHLRQSDHNDVAGSFTAANQIVDEARLKVAESHRLRSACGHSETTWKTVTIFANPFTGHSAPIECNSMMAVLSGPPRQYPSFVIGK